MCKFSVPVFDSLEKPCNRRLCILGISKVSAFLDEYMIGDVKCEGTEEDKEECPFWK